MYTQEVNETNQVISKAAPSVKMIKLMFSPPNWQNLLFYSCQTLQNEEHIGFKLVVEITIIIIKKKATKHHFKHMDETKGSLASHRHKAFNVRAFLRSAVTN